MPFQPLSSSVHYISGPRWRYMPAQCMRVPIYAAVSIALAMMVVISNSLHAPLRWSTLFPILRSSTTVHPQHFESTPNFPKAESTEPRPPSTPWRSAMQYQSKLQPHATQHVQWRELEAASLSSHAFVLSVLLAIALLLTAAFKPRLCRPFRSVATDCLHDIAMVPATGMRERLL